MAETGCEFYCGNEKCKNYKSGLVLTSPWPLGEIDPIINDLNVVKVKEARAHLIKCKAEGMKYARINMPNIHDIPTVGYRITMWCNQCPCVWSYDIMNPDNKDLETLINDAKKEGKIEKKCQKCGDLLRDFNEVLKDGIYCLVCKEKLTQSVWFSNQEE